MRPSALLGSSTHSISGSQAWGIRSGRAATNAALSRPRAPSRRLRRNSTFSWDIASVSREQGPAPEQRGGPVALLAALVPKPVENGHHVFHPDRLAPADRAAGMIEPEREAGVHVLLRADALADREPGLVHELADDPAEDEPGSVVHPLRREAEPGEERLRRLRCE